MTYESRQSTPHFDTKLKNGTIVSRRFNQPGIGASPCSQRATTFGPPIPPCSPPERPLPGRLPAHSCEAVRKFLRSRDKAVESGGSRARTNVWLRSLDSSRSTRLLFGKFDASDPAKWVSRRALGSADASNAVSRSIDGRVSAARNHWFTLSPASCFLSSQITCCHRKNPEDCRRRQSISRNLSPSVAARHRPGQGTAFIHRPLRLGERTSLLNLEPRPLVRASFSSSAL